MGQGEDLEESVDGRVVLCCSSHRFTGILWWICYQDDAPSLSKVQAGSGARLGSPTHPTSATAVTGVEACRERALCDASITWLEHPGLQLQGKRAVTPLQCPYM